MSRLPAPPPRDELEIATEAARVVSSRVLTRDAELRMLWEGAPDGGEAMRAWVERLRVALGA